VREKLVSEAARIVELPEGVKQELLIRELKKITAVSMGV